ncbi:MAG: hypothetical protein ACKV0T_19125 [Planctomycetales bacterium]
MNPSSVIFWASIAAGGVAIPAALYGLHRLCLWLEERGHLFYLHKYPTSSAASCLVALEQFIEPGAQLVVQVVEEAERGEVDGSDPDRPGMRRGLVLPGRSDLAEPGDRDML